MTATEPAQTGEELRDAALDLLDTSEARRIYIRRAQHAMLDILETAGEATIDELRDRCPPPSVFDGRILGAVASGLDKAGVIQFVRYERTKRAAAHCRPRVVWRLAGDPFAVAAWKAENPLP